MHYRKDFWDAILCIIVKIFGTPFYVVLTSKYDKGQKYLIWKDLIG